MKSFELKVGKISIVNSEFPDFKFGILNEVYFFSLKSKEFRDFAIKDEISI